MDAFLNTTSLSSVLSPIISLSLSLLKLYFKSLFLLSLSFTRSVISSNSFALFALSSVVLIYLVYLVSGFIISITLKPLIWSLRAGLMLASLGALVYCFAMYPSATSTSSSSALPDAKLTEEVSELLFANALGYVSDIGQRFQVASQFVLENLHRLVLDHYGRGGEL